MEEMKKIHNSASHYQQVGRFPTEDTPLKKMYFDESLHKYCTTFEEHWNYYDLFDSQEIMSEFLKEFDNNFVPKANLEIVIENEKL